MATRMLSRRHSGFRYRGTSVMHEVNRIHPYPGMMSPAVIEAVLDEYGAGVRTVLDPFCGTGRVLVAARNRGLHSVGVDMNPLATLIAKARLLPPRWERVGQTCAEIVQVSTRLRGAEVMRRIRNHQFDFGFWFPERATKELAQLVTAIELQTSPRSHLRTALLVCFSETVRMCSYTRGSEHKLYRIGPAERRSFFRSPRQVFKAVSDKNSKWLRLFQESPRVERRRGSIELFRSDIRQICRGKLRRRTFDAIVTSPPYGDAKTTVAYGQFSRLPLLWIQAMQNPPFRMSHEEIMSLDQRALGGRLRGELCVPGEIAQRVVRRVEQRDCRRAKEVAAYLCDLWESLVAVCRRLRRGGLAVFVLGRRVVAGLRVPLDEIVREWLETLSVQVEDVISRDIPYKRIPRRVARKGVSGADHALTILEERVLIGRMALSVGKSL